MIKIYEQCRKIKQQNKIGYVILNSDVKVEKRGELISHFADNPDCPIFLSTDAGGTGLNLQMADTVINVELPWNPAKINQRVGRINRIGQKAKKLTVINLVRTNCIESRIQDMLALKQSLFDAVLDEKLEISEVDFEAKG
ncbi:MAG: SWF/SNF helicase family protein [Oligoflexia bacterium]|nr:SWF/SNF helicase family protein [Oligoflexia bacterium]